MIKNIWTITAPAATCNVNCEFCVWMNVVYFGNTLIYIYCFIKVSPIKRIKGLITSVNHLLSTRCPLCILTNQSNQNQKIYLKTHNLFNMRCVLVPLLLNLSPP